MTQKAYAQTRTAGFGKDSRFGFSVQVGTGILSGQAEEIVYRDAQTWDYSSQLLWDIKPLRYVGAGLSFTINDLRGDTPGFYTNVSFKAGIPLRTGKMEDRDWLNPLDSSMLTHYSISNNYTTGAFLTDLALGVSFPLTYGDKIFAFLKIEGALSYMYFEWMARDGYYQYDQTNGWSSSIPRVPLSGDQVAYYQHWLMFSPGIAVTIPIRPCWQVEVSFNAAPGSIGVWALDKHILRQVEFQDHPTGGILAEPGLKVSYMFNEHLALTGALSYRYILRSVGDSRHSTDSGEYSSWSDNSAGAGFYALDMGLTLKVFF